MSGLDLLRKCREATPQTHFIVITAYGDVETAVEAVKLGADDYLTKPFLFDDLLLRIGRVLEHASLQRNHEALQEELGARYESRGLVGQSPAMEKVRDLIRRVAATNSNVLILGESGTGKEVVARTIHRVSDRKDRRLVAVNCAALPDSLLESELFGYAKGAFTGAARDKEGLLPGGGRRDAFPGRNRRDAGLAAEQAASRDRVEGDHPGRLLDVVEGGRADLERHEHGPGGGHPRQPPAGRAVLPVERGGDPPAAAAGAQAGHPRARGALRPAARRGTQEARHAGWNRRRWPC